MIDCCPLSLNSDIKFLKYWFNLYAGEGLTTIIDTVESSLGVPDPDELARAEAALEPNSEPNGVDSVTSIDAGNDTEPNSMDTVTIFIVVGNDTELNGIDIVTISVVAGNDTAKWYGHSQRLFLQM